MSEFAANFLLMHVHNSSLVVQVMLGVIWVMLLAAGVWSVVSQPQGVLWKFLWCTALIVLPWLGLFVYSFRCVVVSDFAFLKPLGLRARKLDSLKAEPTTK